MTKVYALRDWRFNPSEAVLRRDGEERRLEDRAARTLEVLCARRGEVVSKEELLAEVWRGRFVSANSVAVVIGSLRRALDDDPRAPTIILTINKRGYRLAAEAAASPAPEAEPPRRSRGRQTWTTVGLAAAAALIVASQAVLTPRTLLVVEPTRDETNRPAFDGLTRALGPVVLDAAIRLKRVRVTTSPTPTDARLPRVTMRSRLILWNGAPELAMTATDLATGTVLWSSFAAGPEGALAHNAATRLATLQPRLH